MGPRKVKRSGKRGTLKVICLHRGIRQPIVYQAVEHWLPSDPPRPCPDLLTAEEAILFLRLDRTGVQSPRRSLDKYREQGLIRTIQIGKRIVFPLQDLLHFIQYKRNNEPR